MNHKIYDEPDQNHQAVLLPSQSPPGFSHPTFSFFLSAKMEIRSISQR
jgi:hypothetical protein